MSSFTTTRVHISSEYDSEDELMFEIFGNGAISIEEGTFEFGISSEDAKVLYQELKKVFEEGGVNG